jgi:hypothetical protein
VRGSFVIRERRNFLVKFGLLKAHNISAKPIGGKFVQARSGGTSPPKASNPGQHVGFEARLLKQEVIKVDTMIVCGVKAYMVHRLELAFLS